MKNTGFLLDPRRTTSFVPTETKAALFRGISEKEIETIIANSSFSSATTLMEKSGFSYQNTLESGENAVFVFYKPGEGYVFYNLDSGFLGTDGSFYIADNYYWLTPELLEDEIESPIIAIFSHETPREDGQAAYAFRLYDISLKPCSAQIDGKTITHLICSAKENGNILDGETIGWN